MCGAAARQKNVPPGNAFSGERRTNLSPPTSILLFTISSSARPFPAPICHITRLGRNCRGGGEGARFRNFSSRCGSSSRDYSTGIQSKLGGKLVSLWVNFITRGKIKRGTILKARAPIQWKKNFCQKACPKLCRKPILKMTHGQT